MATDPFNLQGGMPSIPAVPSVAPAAGPTVPTGNNAQPMLRDLTGSYADVNGTIYNKQTGRAFSTPQEFFGEAGVNSFNNLKFDTGWTPQQQAYRPTAGPVQQTPAPMGGASTPPAPSSGQPTFGLANGTRYDQNGNAVTPTDPNQNIAAGAGQAGISTPDYLNLLGSETSTNSETLKQIYDQLGIPQAQTSAFALPSDSTVDVYNQAYNTAGLAGIKQSLLDINDQIAAETNQYNQAVGKENENPFLSEASRVGRVQNLYNLQQETMANLLNKQQNLQTLYAQGVNEANNLVTRYSNDFQTNSQLNQQKLTYLFQQAEKQASATQNSKTQELISRYMPSFLSSTAQTKAAVTPFGNAQTGFYVYNPSTRSYTQVTAPIPSYQANPLTGTLFNQLTGQPPTSIGSGGGGFPSRAQTPGSAAAVNNVSGMKQNGQFIQYSSPDQSFQATVQDIQNKISGNTSTGLNSNSTLTDFVNTWVNGNAKAPAQGYTAANVAQYLQQLGVQGVTPNTPIGQLNPSQLATAVAHFETGFAPGQTTQNNPAMSAAQMLISGQASVDQFSTRGDYQQILTYANQLSLQQTGKPFDVQASSINYQNLQAGMKNAVPLIQAQQTALNHLDNLTSLIQKAGFTNNVQANNLRIASSDNISKNPNIVALQSEINIVRGEIAKVLASGGAPTDADEAQAAQILPYNVSPDTFDTIKNNIQTLMAEKIKQYSNPSNIPQLGGSNVTDSNSGTTDISTLRTKYGY